MFCWLVFPKWYCIERFDKIASFIVYSSFYLLFYTIKRIENKWHFHDMSDITNIMEIKFYALFHDMKWCIICTHDMSNIHSFADYSCSQKGWEHFKYKQTHFLLMQQWWGWLLNLLSTSTGMTNYKQSGRQDWQFTWQTYNDKYINIDFLFLHIKNSILTKFNGPVTRNS